MTPEDEKACGRLPLPGDRWIPRRKAMVIAALREGETTVEEVCRLYSLSRDELASWIASFERHGISGLRATRVQLYRELKKTTYRAGEPVRRRASPGRPGQFEPHRT
jgi:transposase-like protein